MPTTDKATLTFQPIAARYQVRIVVTGFEPVDNRRALVRTHERTGAAG